VRTPNTKCLLCRKPLYRRPSDIARARYSACMACRSEAQKVAGITAEQLDGLKSGRQKGENHRTGYRHREESKQRTAEANRKFWATHPELAVERGAKSRGERHYRWNGGVSKLNASLRRMTENRKWMDAVKARDGACTRCGSLEHLESHHCLGLSVLIETLAIKNRDDARQHAGTVWCLDNGITLCRPCHYQEHGRRHAD